MRSHTLIAVCACLFITACGTKGAALTYSLTLKTSDSAHRMELVNAAERTVRRRMAANSIGGTVMAIPQGEKGKLTIMLADARKADTVKSSIDQPFDIQLKGELKRTSTLGDEQWEDGGVGGKDIEWVQVFSDRATGKIGAEIILTPDGKAKMSAAFTKYANGDIGIFIRGLLVSRLQVSPQLTGDHVVITGIPSATIAQVFADDVNVGLHVEFTPQ